MDMTKKITKKQKNLLKKYAEKYGKNYLVSYAQEKYPGINWADFEKEHAQYVITGRKKHERKLKGL